MIDLLRNALAAVLRFFAPRAIVAAENLLLRHQLVVLRRSSPRPRLRRLDRWLIATLATRARSLLEAVIVVRPATVLQWHRAAWRLWWLCRSSRRVGRPPIDAELRDLIRRMWRENRLWGENRIAGELAKLGWRVSPRTVAKYRPKHLERGRGQGWRTFLRNHASQVWSCDFFTVVTVHFQTLYAFVVVSLERREIVHVGVTAHPTGAWVAQRMIEAVGDAPPRYLLHDRDSIYDARFRGRLRGLGVRGLLSRLPERRWRTRFASAWWGHSVATASITSWFSASATPSASCASTFAITTAGRIAACAPSRPQARAGSLLDEQSHPVS